MANNYTFAILKKKVDEIANRVETNLTRIETARSQVNHAVTDLVQMESSYTQVLAEIDDRLAADPSNTALKSISDEKDILLLEFAAQKNDAEKLKSAMDAN